MGDHDQGAGPVVEEVLEHVQGLDVEVVGGLVEQQHVGLGEQQPEQLEAPPLATGQVADPRGQPVAGEAEPLQHRRRGDLAGRGPGHPPDRLDRRRAPAPRGSRSSSACVRCCSATVRPRFTRPAVGASAPSSSASTDDFPAPLTPTIPTRSPGPEPPGGVRQQRPVAAHQVDVLDVDDVLAEPLGGEALELEPVARRRLVVDQRRRRRRSGTSASTVRAGGPRRSQASSLRARLRRRTSDGRRLALPLGLGEHERGVPALVGVDRPRRAPPRSARTPRRGTTGRG